jgi:AbrB family looped-hinge helix DNA binding protein
VKERFTTVTRKGQITIPVEIRKALGLKVGDRVALVADHQEARLTRTGSVVQRTAGALKSTRGPLSPRQEREEFEQGVAEEVVGTLQD